MRRYLHCQSPELFLCVSVCRVCVHNHTMAWGGNVIEVSVLVDIETRPEAPHQTWKRRGWKVAQSLRALVALAGELGFNPQTPQGVLSPSVIPEDPTHRRAHGVHACTRAKHPHTQSKINKSKNISKETKPTCSPGRAYTLPGK